MKRVEIGWNTELTYYNLNLFKSCYILLYFSGIGPGATYKCQLHCTDIWIKICTTITARDRTGLPKLIARALVKTAKPMTLGPAGFAEGPRLKAPIFRFWWENLKVESRQQNFYKWMVKKTCNPEVWASWTRERVLTNTHNMFCQRCRPPQFRDFACILLPLCASPYHIQLESLT